MNKYEKYKFKNNLRIIIEILEEKTDDFQNAIILFCQRDVCSCDIDLNEILNLCKTLNLKNKNEINKLHDTLILFKNYKMAIIENNYYWNLLHISVNKIKYILKKLIT